MASFRFLSTLLVSSLLVVSASKREAESQLSPGGSKRSRKNPFETVIVDDGSVRATYDETFELTLGLLPYTRRRTTRSQMHQMTVEDTLSVAPAPAELQMEQPRKLTIRIKTPEPKSISKKCPRVQNVSQETQEAKAPVSLKIPIKIPPASRKCPRYQYHRSEDVTEQEEAHVEQPEKKNVDDGVDSNETERCPSSTSNDEQDAEMGTPKTPSTSYTDWDNSYLGMEEYRCPTPGVDYLSYESDNTLSSAGFFEASSPLMTPSTPRTPGCYSDEEGYGMNFGQMHWEADNLMVEPLW